MALSQPNNQILILQSFGSFEELATIVHGYGADFRQISSSEKNHQVLQVMMDGVLMSRACFGCHVDQRGQTPRGLRTFALLEEGSPPMYWFGRSVGPEDLLVFPTHGEIEVISRPGFSTLTFSIAMDDLAEFFERSGGPDLNSVLYQEDTVVPLAPVHLHQLRNHLNRISFTHSTLQRSLALYDAYRDKLFALLLDIFRSKAFPRPSLDHQFRSQVIRDVVALVNKRADEPLRLEDLCGAVKIPERTLNETFRRELGISPAAFMKGYRLFRVHRMLWWADPALVGVTDVANTFGFWHMGQFAADYRKLFGELPSETLRRLN
jgi:AraC-like DNA-binding protein